MKLKTTSKIGAALFMAFALTSAAHALPQLTGGLRMSANGSTVSVDFGTNEVTFSPNNTGNGKVDTASGVLAGIVAAGDKGDLVDYKNFKYAPLSVTGGNPIWNIALKGLSFDILSVTSYVENPSTLNNPFASVAIYGTGLLKKAGYVDTTGFWTFSADSSESGKPATFGWSSTATGVPDGGTTIALLGLSLLGLHGARRKFAKP